MLQRVKKSIQQWHIYILIQPQFLDCWDYYFLCVLSMEDQGLLFQQTDKINLRSLVYFIWSWRWSFTFSICTISYRLILIESFSLYVCVCVFEKAEAQRNTRKDKEEKKLLLINLAMFIICMVFMLYSVAIKQTESPVFVWDSAKTDICLVASFGKKCELW